MHYVGESCISLASAQVMELAMEEGEDIDPANLSALVKLVEKENALQQQQQQQSKPP
jgi:hypothetical protein